MPDRAWTLQQIEAALAGLPRPEFRRRLRADLERRATMPTMSRPDEAGSYVHTSDRPTAEPVLRLRSAASAIDFYTRAFGAREVMRFAVGDQVPHAEIVIGSALIILADANAAIGFPGPDTLGGTPVTIRLDVDDPDAAVARAVAEGATIFRPVHTEFYGERSGIIVDPFGYRWTLTKVVEPMTVAEMHRRMTAGGGPPPEPARDWIPEGYHTVTPYLVVADAPAVIDFTKAVFGAQEKMRAVGSAGGVHAEVRIGDSMLMIGGGAPELAWRGDPMPSALHVYVPDVDAAFARAFAAGATADHAPRDMDYGERGCGVIDAGGNRWYIATAAGPSFTPRGLHAVNAYLHPLRAEPLLAFLVRTFGATGIEKHATPDGVVHHAKVQVGDSVIEIGDADDVLCLRARCGCGVSACARGRRDVADEPGRPALRRPSGGRDRPVWQPVVPGEADSRRQSLTSAARTKQMCRKTRFRTISVV